MDKPPFSQIPSLVLNKLRAEPNKSKKKKAVKFYEDEDVEIESIDENDLNEANIDANNVTNKSKKRKAADSHEDGGRSDAIIQTEPGPEKISRHTQTELVFPFDLNMEDLSYESYAAILQAKSLGHKTNIYPIPKRDGKPPPLKIGLTLPKGKKRKVFYPDDE